MCAWVALYRYVWVWSRAELIIGKTGQMPGVLRFWGPRAFGSLELEYQNTPLLVFHVFRLFTTRQNSRAFRLVYRLGNWQFRIYRFWVSQKNWTKQHHAVWPNRNQCIHGSGVQRSGDARGDCLIGCPLPNSDIEQWSMVVIVIRHMLFVTLQYMTSLLHLQTNVLANFLTQHAYSGTSEER